MSMSSSSPQKFNAKLLLEIDEFSTVCAKGESGRLSKPFYNCEEDNSTLKWHLVLIPSGNGPNDNVCFELCCDSVTPLEKCITLKGDVRIEFIKNSVLDPEGTRDKSFDIASVDNELHEILLRFDFKFSELNKWTDETTNRISISCKVGYTKILDKCSLSRDLGRIYMDKDFSDVTISVKGKDYPAHKVILSARSSVFKTMFRTEMLESQKNNVIINGIEQETFEEMLHYIYTGEMPNLDESAFELLPAADEYDLKELKNACEKRLLSEISADNVGKILVRADMHNSKKLKANALLFIKTNYSNWEDFRNAEIWKIFETRPGLMKEMLELFFRK